MEMTTENYFEDTDVLARIMVQTPEQFHGHNQLHLYPQALSEVLCVYQPRGDTIKCKEFLMVTFAMISRMITMIQSTFLISARDPLH